MVPPIGGDDRRRFGQWLREQRRAAQQTQAHTARKVARATGIPIYQHGAWVSRVEHGAFLHLTTSEVLFLAEAVGADHATALDMAGWPKQRPADYMKRKNRPVSATA